MTAYHNPAFMADLLLGVCYSQDICGGLWPADGLAAATGEDLQTLEKIVDRLRAQTIHIAASCRRWRARYGEIGDPLARRYAAYEGALCRQDLRQHWLLYRHAMGELMALKREMAGPGRRAA